MGQVVVVGLDIAKSVFQVHDVDADGEVVVRRTTKVAAVALANKTAGRIWAIMTNGERYREPGVQVA